MNFEYDDAGRIVQQQSPWQDSSKDDTDSAVQVSYYYTPHPGDNATGIVSKPRTIIRKTGEIVTSKTFYNYQVSETEVVHIVERAYDNEASYGDLGNERSVTTYYGSESNIPEISRGQKKSVLSANGKRDSFFYSRNAKGELITTVIQGSKDHPEGIANKTIKTVVKVDAKGNQTQMQVHLCTGPNKFTQSPIVEISHQYDALNNLVQTTKNGQVVYEATYDGTHLVESVGEDGSGYQYHYDSLERLTEVIKKGVAAYDNYPAQLATSTLTHFNAVGQKIMEESGYIKADGTREMSGYVKYKYDGAGRIIETRNPGFNPGEENELVTTTHYGEGGRIITVTKPDGTQSIKKRGINGRIFEEQGCCIVDKFYEFFVNDNGFRVNRKSIVARDGLRWNEETTDLLGRTVLKEQPAFNNEGTLKQQFIYDARGFLIKSIEPGKGDTLFEYDELGQMVRKGVDVNNNGALDTSGEDLISEGETLFEFNADTDAWYQVSRSYTYANENSGQRTLLEEQRTRVNHFPKDSYGLLSAERIQQDIHGNISSARVYVDRNKRITTQITDVPQSDRNAISISYNGLLMESYEPSSELPICYAYDAMGKQTAVMAPTGQQTIKGESIYQRKATVYWENNGLKHWESLGRGTLSASGQWKLLEDSFEKTTYYEYYQKGQPHVGRIKSVRTDIKNTPSNLEDDLIKYFSYNDKGMPWRTWGNATIPMEYSYDTYAQVTSYRTFRNKNDVTWGTDDVWSASIKTAGGDETDLQYDPYSGLTIKQTDASNNSRKMDYTPWGKLENLTNARGQIANFSYDSVQGSLIQSTFNNDSGLTPDVYYDYDRLGRIKGIEDGVFEYSMSYNSQTQQIESVDMNGLGEMGINKRHTSEYETVSNGISGRPSGWSISDQDGVYEEFSQTFAYDDRGRLEAIKSSHTPGQNDRYFYRYGENGNVLHAIEYLLPSQNQQLVSEYTYSPENGKVKGLQNTIDGEASSQVLSHYSYTFDQSTDMIQTVSHQGKAYAGSEYFTEYEYGEDRFQLSKTVNYTGTDIRNKSNPIQNQRWSYSYDNMGNRLSANEAGVRNTYTSNALNQYSTATGFGSLTYDADGNLEDDNNWDYKWDALNRLVEMTPKEVSNGAKKLAYQYDYMSRRVRKKVWTWQVNAWIKELDEKYLYDEWNLVAVYNGLNNDTLLRTYTWGRDISGTLRGAGGIGGLLSVQEHSGTYEGKKFLYVYDAVGNVTQLIDSEDGTIVAKYQYDSYGNTITATGTGYEQINPFRYQTKFTDNESELVYYGYRYYSSNMGRFLNQDPIGIKGGLNIYAFLANDPVNKREYLGLYKDGGTGQNPNPVGGVNEKEWWELLGGRWICLNCKAVSNGSYHDDLLWRNEAYFNASDMNWNLYGPPINDYIFDMQNAAHVAMARENYNRFLQQERQRKYSLGECEKLALAISTREQALLKAPEVLSYYGDYSGYVEISRASSILTISSGVFSAGWNGFQKVASGLRSFFKRIGQYGVSESRTADRIIGREFINGMLEEGAKASTFQIVIDWSFNDAISDWAVSEMEKIDRQLDELAQDMKTWNGELIIMKSEYDSNCP